MKNSILRMVILATVIMTMMTSMVSNAGHMDDPLSTPYYENDKKYNNAPEDLELLVTDNAKPLYKVGETAELKVTVEHDMKGDNDGINKDLLFVIEDPNGDLIASYPELPDAFTSENHRKSFLNNDIHRLHLAQGESFDVDFTYDLEGVTPGETVELKYTVYDYGKGMTTTTDSAFYVTVSGWSHTETAEGSVFLKVAKNYSVDIVPTILEMKEPGTEDEKLETNIAAGEVRAFVDGKRLDYSVDPLELPETTVIKFKAVPADGYKFVTWKYNYVNLLSPSMDDFRKNPRTVTVPSKDVRFTPTPVFVRTDIEVPIETHDLTIEYVIDDRDPMEERTYKVSIADTEVEDGYPLTLAYMVDNDKKIIELDDELEFGELDYTFTTGNKVGVEEKENVKLYFWDSANIRWRRADTVNSKILYEVFFDVDGGTFDDPELEYQYGYKGLRDAAEEPVVSKEGFIFTGWDNVDDVNLDRIDKSGTVIAQWEADYNIWTSADDHAKVYIDGQYFRQINSYNRAEKYWVTLDDDYKNDHMIAVKAWDNSGRANIAGFKLVLEEENGSFNSTDADWYVFYDNGKEPNPDGDNNPWTSRDYMSDDWEKVTSFTLAQAPSPRNWTSDDQFPDSEVLWIWNENFDVPSSDKIDTPVYLRSMTPKDVKWTVSFDMNGGTDGPDSFKIKDGEKANRPTEVPSRDGYTFEGWYLGNEAFEFENETNGVTSHITLTADWEKIPGPWTVDYDSNGGSEAPDDETVAHNDSATEPADDENPTKGGHDFTGWYKIIDSSTGETSDTAYTFSESVTEDVTLKAGWEEIFWTVTYDANEGTGAPQAHEVSDGATVATPASEPSRTDYDFVEWQLKGSKFEFGIDQVTDHITLVALWQPVNIPVVEHTVTYVPNNGDSSTQEKVISGSNARNWTPEREHFDFVAWQLGGAAYGFGQVTSNITLDAVWTPTMYTVTFNADGGVDEPVDQERIYNSTATEPADPVKAGSDFVAWYEYYGPQDGYASTPYNFEAPITHNIDLMAIYSDLSWTVTFDANGGTFTTSSLPVGDGKTVTEPTSAPVRDGYDFAGWNLEGNAFGFGSYQVYNDITLVAQWTPAVVVPVYHTVTFVVNNGDNPVDNQVLDGDTVASWTPQRDGFEFVEWQLNGEAFDFDTTITDDVELDGVWVAVETTITTEASSETAASSQATTTTTTAGGGGGGGGGNNNPPATTATTTNIPDAIVPEAALPQAVPTTPVPEATEAPETTVDLGDIVDLELIPEAPLEEIPDDVLPQTSGLPLAAYAGIGMAMTGIGYRLRRNKK